LLSDARKILKTDLRPKGHAQIVEGAFTEIDFVASLKTQSERTPEAFDTSTRINRKVRSRPAYA